MEANEPKERVVGKEVNKKQFVGANFNLLYMDFDDNSVGKCQ